MTRSSKPGENPDPKADGLDDFDREARNDAAEYVKSQAEESERQRIKVENKQRRLQGLPLEKAPRRDKAKGSRPIRANDNAGPCGSGSERQPYEKIARSDFDYEGQVILPFNPLYKLAEMVEPQTTASRARFAKNRLLDEWAASDRSAGAADNVKPVTDLDEPKQSKSRDLGSSTMPEEEDEEVEYIEEDDSVLVPWGQEIPATDTRIHGMSGVEEEGSYSEDEAMQPSPGTENVNEPSLSADSCANIDRGLSPFRPHFEPLSDRSTWEHLQLDDGIAVPASINHYLRPYQREGVKFMYDKYKQGVGGVLGDDMGLGKTIQVISFLSAVMRKTGDQCDFERRKSLIRSSTGGISAKHWPTVLIICPKSLIGNWTREIETWGYFEMREWRSDTMGDVQKAFQQGFLDLLLATYDSVRSSIDVLKSLPLSLVIADEAHRIKEPKGRLALAMKKFHGPSCFALTGTLIQNRLEEMWSVLDFVHRGHAGTLTQWRDFVVNPIKRGQRHEGRTDEVVMSILRLGVMHKKILPHFCLRRTKKLIADELPTKRDLIVFCPLASRQVSAYKAFIVSEDVEFVIRREEQCDCGSNQRRKDCHYQHNAAGESVNDVLLKCITSAVKIANHFGLLYPAPDDTEKTLAINRRLYHICTGLDYRQRSGNAYEAAIDPENCGKWTLLSQLLETWRAEPVNNKVLIFSNTVRLLKMINDFITANFSGFDHNLLTGEVDGIRRQEMVDDFQDADKNHFLLLVSTLAGGVGLNLTAANKVVIFDPAWNPAHDLQAMDRAFRIGQKREVEVYRMIAQGTIEENIYERQIQKEQRARQLNEGTFERRIHQGVDRARNRDEQGELYGVQNLFSYKPEGTVPKNLDRVLQAEDRFLQDMIEAEYASDEDSEADSSSDDAVGEQTRRARKIQAQRRATAKSKSTHEDGHPAGHDPDDTLGGMLRSLGVQAHEHSAAFKDSPGERAMFEIGLQLLHDDPQLAKSVKMNDIGKNAGKRKTNQTDKPVKQARLAADPDSEPWTARVTARDSGQAAKPLAVLSDDEDS